MKARRQTPHQPVTQLFCDRFRQGPDYANWRPSGSEDWLLIHTVDGAGEFGTRLGSYTAHPGATVLYAPGDAQDYSTSPTVGHWDLIWVHFRPRTHWEPWLEWPRHLGGVRHLEWEAVAEHEPFQAALDRMLDLSRRSIAGSLDFAANALEEALLWARVAASRSGSAPRDERVRQAVDHLSANLREPLSLDELAARCGLSVSRLAHVFKAQTGYAPRQFLELRRMQHACHLLRLTNLSVAQVAREVGYDDAFYFSNRFRRTIGQSPLQFRNRALQDQRPGGE